MKLPLALALLVTGLFSAAGFAADPAPVYGNKFESGTVDQAPEGAMAIAGDFLIKQEGANKFLELPGEPLDTFGILLGPAGKKEF